jgi:hypothetical protein
MNFSFRIKIILVFLFHLIFSNTNSFSASKLIVTEVNNDIFILDVYGKRFALKNSYSIKSGYFLKTKNLPASFVLKNKSKICLAANSSLKLTALNSINENHEITFEFQSGNILFSIPNLSSDKHNINFFSYSLKEFENDVILSKNNALELINYENRLKLFYKDKININILPFSYLRLSKNGAIIKNKKILNTDNVKSKFLNGCINPISKVKQNKNSKQLQNGCFTQYGKLVCRKRYK